MIIAVEAPSFAGKSFLLEGIKDSGITVVSEACDYVGGNKNFPKIPFTNLKEAKANAHFFVAVESRRQADAKRIEDNGQVALLDRCSPISCVILQQFIRDFRPELHNFTGAYDAAVEIFANAIAQNVIALPQSIVRLTTNETTFNQRTARGTSIPAFKVWENFLKLQNLYDKALRVYPDSQILLLTSDNTTETTIENQYKLRDFAKRDDVVSPSFLKMFEFDATGGTKDVFEAVEKANRLMDVTNFEYRKVSEGVCVRKGAKDDVSSFREIMLKTLKDEWGFDYDPILNADLDDPFGHYGGNGAFFVLEVNGTVVGTMALKDEGGTAYWKRLSILPEHRKKGYLTPMMELLETYSRSKKFENAKFDTLRETGMYLAYERRGFTILSEELEGQFTKLVMQKKL